MEFGESIFLNETHYVSKSVTFIWKIKNFSLCPVNFDDCISSGRFKFEGEHFYLSAQYQSGGIPKSYPIFRVDVRRYIASGSKIINKLSLLNEHNEEKYFSYMEMLPNTKGSVSYYISKLQLLALKEEFYPDDCLKIVCKVMITDIKQDLVIDDLSKDMLRELHAAADKYSVKELKDVCSEANLDRLGEDHIKYYTTLSNKRKEQKLMCAVVCFIARNPRIINSELWKELLRIIPNLADQVLRERTKPIT